jgi:DNA-binding NtrC family response regulator
MPINVVYLDDEEDLCHLFKQYLDSNLIKVKTFSDEERAIEYCNQKAPDIAFIDYRLKSITGLEVAHAIKTRTLKVLVSGEFNIVVDSCIEKIIEKPFRLADIKTFILEHSKET